MNGNAAIYFVREAFTRSGPKLMGRNAAGEFFLRGWLQHAEDIERYFAFCPEPSGAQAFAEFAQRYGRSGRGVEVVLPTAPGRISAAGSLFVSAPGIGEMAWQRRFFGDTAWSICGLTCTISSDRVMRSFGELLTAPVHPWDAVICISRAVREVVDAVLARHAAYLGERLGVKRVPRPQLPVIPLGIHAADYAPDARMRRDFRNRHGIPDDDLVFLFVGRLSFHAKAHPLPMYLGLEAAARRTGKRLWLVECGRFYNPSIERAFVEGARQFCPSVRHLVVDGRSQEDVDAAWRGADIFVSLSDNIQESFGLTPVEAMAAGLPVIATDWDGYRDTLTDGETALLVPTRLPAAGCGAALAARYAWGADDYDRYIGQVSQMTVVDVGAVTEACCRLIEDPALRRRLGDNGLRAARDVFDWSRIVPRYQALWAELSARRAAAAPMPPRLPALMDDPFRVFAGFARARIDADTRVVASADQSEETFRHRAGVWMNRFAAERLLPEDELLRLLDACRGTPRRFGDLIEGLDGDRAAVALRSLGWLLKIDVIRIAE